MGERFFDHYDLVTLEDQDYYPDGRDLGENNTYTSWLMSPCVKSGKLSCLHCHTSSGRFRQKKDPDAACLPCHQARVEKAAEHTRHPADSPGSRCIACHLPRTIPALVAAAGDEIRLVRVKAAAALIGYPRGNLKPEEARRLEKANAEYLAFVQARPDQWTARYNLGNY